MLCYTELRGLRQRQEVRETLYNIFSQISSICTFLIWTEQSWTLSLPSACSCRCIWSVQMSLWSPCWRWVTTRTGRGVGPAPFWSKTSAPKPGRSPAAGARPEHPDHPPHLQDTRQWGASKTFLSSFAFSFNLLKFIHYFIKVWNDSPLLFTY